MHTSTHVYMTLINLMYLNVNTVINVNHQNHLFELKINTGNYS